MENFPYELLITLYPVFSYVGGKGNSINALLLSEYWGNHQKYMCVFLPCSIINHYYVSKHRKSEYKPLSPNLNILWNSCHINYLENTQHLWVVMGGGDGDTWNAFHLFSVLKQSWICCRAKQYIWKISSKNIPHSETSSILVKNCFT